MRKTWFLLFIQTKNFYLWLTTEYDNRKYTEILFSTANMQEYFADSLGFISSKSMHTDQLIAVWK